MASGASRVICSVSGADFLWNPAERKYISTIRRDGSEGAVCSRIPEKVWYEYKNGLSVLLMELVRGNRELELTAFPDWLRCRWNEDEAWATAGFGEVTKKVLQCRSPMLAAGQFYRVLCAHIDRRITIFREGSG